MTGIICNRQQLTDALNITQRHIDNLIGAGIVVKLARGEYDLIQSCKNYVEFLRGSQSAEKLDLTEERTRLTRYQADLCLLQLQQARAEYLPIDIIKLYFQKITSTIRSKFSALTSHICTDILPGIDKADAVKIDDAIRAILSEAASMPMPSEIQKRLTIHMKNFSEDGNEKKEK